MINRVRFKNFKALRDVTIGLGPLTVLVGPNASGKTSVLEGLHRLTQVGAKPLMTLFGEGDDLAALRNRGSQGAIELDLAGRWQETEGRLALSIDVERTDAQQPLATLSSTWAGDTVNRSLNALNDDPAWPHRALGEGLGASAFLRLDPQRLAEPSASPSRLGSTPFEGTGLAADLTDLKVTWEDSFRAIEDALRSIVPSVERVRLVRTPMRQTEWESVTIDHERIARPVTRETSGYRVVFDMTGARDIPGNLASEGTLLVLGLLTVLMGHQPPRLVLLDDIDRALHPVAQAELVGQIRKILAARPELQIVATSHSPDMLDALHFEEVRITSLREDGTAACAPLTDHPEYARWKDLVRPGELWTSLAETWVARRADPTP